MQAKIGGLLRGGSAEWLEIDNPFSGQHLSTFAVKLDDKLLAVYGLADELRPESLDVVKAMQAKNIDVYIVSGDNSAAVHSLARTLGIPDTHVKANVLPGNKSEIVHALQSQSQFPVIFCGDGINDAPALSQANVGISFVSAAEITSSSADVLLLSNNLQSLLELMGLSRRVCHRIVLNFVWAGVYNLFAICLAAGVFVVWRIEPKWAGIGEVVSVLPVVIVGWSLRWSSRY
jgi:Cu2+-exporting ATPase